MGIIFQIADWMLTIIVLAIFARAILSWFVPMGRDTWSRVLVDLTEPILAPIRSVLSRILPIPIDFSPIVASMLIIFLQNMLRSAFYN
jgi:YggT family protein